MQIVLLQVPNPQMQHRESCLCLELRMGRQNYKMANVILAVWRAGSQLEANPVYIYTGCQRELTSARNQHKTVQTTGAVGCGSLPRGELGEVRTRATEATEKFNLLLQFDCRPRHFARKPSARLMKLYWLFFSDLQHFLASCHSPSSASCKHVLVWRGSRDAVSRSALHISLQLNKKILHSALKSLCTHLSLSKCATQLKRTLEAA